MLWQMDENQFIYATQIFVHELQFKISKLRRHYLTIKQSIELKLKVVSWALRNIQTRFEIN